MKRVNLVNPVPVYYCEGKSFVQLKKDFAEINVTKPIIEFTGKNRGFYQSLFLRRRNEKLNK